MSETNSDLVDQISKIIRKNKDNITALLDAGSGNSGDTSSFCKKEQESYVNPETGEEVDYEIIFSMSYRDEEPHKFQIGDGRYGIDVRCKMDDTSILLDLKDDMYVFTEKYIKSRENATVTQNYPAHKIRIDYDLEEEDVESILNEV